MHSCCVPVLGQVLGMQCNAQVSEAGKPWGDPHGARAGTVLGSAQNRVWQQETLRKHLLQD